MATLNVKGFPDALYERLKEQAVRQHRSLSQQVVHLLSRAVEEPKPMSLLDLRGLGKEAWRGVDAATYVAEERDSWE
jgi:plasmid stability protein